jgi:tetratricopeptide (TPR) repeat protein
MKVILRIIGPAVLAACCLWVFSNGIDVTPESATGETKDVSLTPEESRELLTEARAYARQGQFDKALGPLQELHAAYPGNHIYLQELASAYGNLNRHKEEAAAWEEFLTNAPMPIEGCPQIGQAYEKQNLRREATEAFRRCLAFDPSNLDSVFYLAHSLEMSQAYDEAAQLYQEGATVDPHYYDLRNGLARVQLHQGKIAEAKETAARVVAENRTNTDAILVLALASWREGNLVQARHYLEQGTAIANRNAELHGILGRVAEEAGDNQKALQEYDVTLQLTGGDPDIARRRDALMRGAR